MADALQLIICTFDATARADEAKRAIQSLDSSLDVLKLGNIAIVSKNDNGEVVFRETDDRRNAWGTAIGGLVEGVTWLVYNFVGMLGPVAGTYAGAQTKAAVQRVTEDTGFPDDALQTIGDRLDAGHAALLVIVDAGDASVVTDELVKLGGHLVTHDLPADLVARLSGEDPATS
jgi:uncharacterized membrane protein